MKYVNCLKNMECLKKIEQIVKKSKNHLVFLCLGNIKVNFDCFASFVARYLKEYNYKSYIYGGEDCLLYGDNLKEMKSFLEKHHKNDTIIFVDVAKTNNENMNGEIIVSKNKYQVANSKVEFNYDYSICYLVKTDSESDHFMKQKNAAEKISIYIANCC